MLVYPFPEVGWNVPTYLAKDITFGVERDEPLTTSFDVFKERTKNAHRQLDMLEERPNLSRIKPEDVFCNTFVPSRCVASLDGKPLYLDDDHLNRTGAMMLSEVIFEATRNKGWL